VMVWTRPSGGGAVVGAAEVVGGDRRWGAAVDDVLAVRSDRHAAVGRPEIQAVKVTFCRGSRVERRLTVHRRRLVLTLEQLHVSRRRA